MLNEKCNNNIRSHTIKKTRNTIDTNTQMNGLLYNDMSVHKHKTDST